MMKKISPCTAYALIYALTIALSLYLTILKISGGHTPLSMLKIFVVMLIVFGFIQFLIVKYILPKIPGDKFKNIFKGIMIFAVPFMVWGFLIGGILGPIGILAFSGIPLAVALIFGYVTLHKEEKVLTRLIVMTLIYLAIILSLVVSYKNSKGDYGVHDCESILFGEVVTTEDGRQICNISEEQKAKNAITLADNFKIDGLDEWKFYNAPFYIGDIRKETFNKDLPYFEGEGFDGKNRVKTSFNLEGIAVLENNLFAVPVEIKLGELENSELENISYVLIFSTEEPGRRSLGAVKGSHRIIGDIVRILPSGKYASVYSLESNGFVRETVIDTEENTITTENL